MFKKMLLIIAAYACVTVSYAPAMAMYSGIADTVENAIQVLAKTGTRNMMYQIHKELPMVQTSSNVSSDANAQKEISTDSNAGRF